MIEIEHLHKTYRSGFTMKPKLALKDVSFNVEAGKVYGFIGPNGAGKSTTIKVLTGLLNFDSGKVLVNGIALLREARGPQGRGTRIPHWLGT